MRNEYKAIKRITLRQSTLILIMGVAASGKTTLSKGILRQIWAVYLDNNFIADAFFSNTRTDLEYVRLRSRLYDVLYRITEENLKIGNSVLLDVPHITHMQSNEWCTFIKELITRTKSKLVVIRCLCSEQVLRQRIESRGEERDKWKLENWEEFLHKEPINVSIPFDYLDINTEDDLLKNIKKSIRYIIETVSDKRECTKKR